MLCVCMYVCAGLANHRPARLVFLVSRKKLKVVECAVANTWRLPVVWELVSGHLRVVAKAREPAKRAYAVRAMRELIVDGVKRLHPLPPAENDAKDHDGGNSGTAASGRGGGSVSSAPPPPPPSSTGGGGGDAAAGNGATRSTATTISAASASASASAGGGTVARTNSRGSVGAPTSSSGGSGGGGVAQQEEGFLPNFLGLRARLEGAMGGEDEQFRWIFDCDVGAVFFVVGGGGAAARGTAAGGGNEFEGVLFKTMGLFALTPHVDTREATLQTLYSILQVTVSRDEKKETGYGHVIYLSIYLSPGGSVDRRKVVVGPSDFRN